MILNAKVGLLGSNINVAYTNKRINSKMKVFYDEIFKSAYLLLVEKRILFCKSHVTLPGKGRSWLMPQPVTRK